jgi:signal transduction histidine kinase
MERTREILSDVHHLAHELHPSELDRLGLVSAAMGLCREVGDQQGLQVNFVFKNIPESLPRDIALCLYRVLQESLCNVVKHSEARQAQVELNGGPGEIRLTVSDKGVGFDPGPSQKKGGLGLISMHERLQLVGGRITIESGPLRGTRIQASVPLGVAPATQLTAETEGGR